MSNGSEIHLNIKNFFKHYIAEPRAKELSKRDRNIATVALAFLCLPPFFIVPLTIWAVRKIRKESATSATSSSSASKTSTVASRQISSPSPLQTQPPKGRGPLPVPPPANQPSAGEQAPPPAGAGEPVPADNLEQAKERRRQVRMQRLAAAKAKGATNPRLEAERRRAQEEAERAAFKAAVADLGGIASSGVEPNKMAGMPNFTGQMSNICFFNSSVQSLEALFLSQDNTFSELLKHDLSLQEGETFEALEERLLHGWSPCVDQTGEIQQELERMREELSGIQQRETALQEEMAALDEGVDRSEFMTLNSQITEELQACRSQIANLETQNEEMIKDRRNAIEFKWSFLAMIQAKEYGTEDQLKLAMKAHRSVLFSVSPEITQRTNGQQLDPAAYFEVFGNLLNTSRVNLRTTLTNADGYEGRIEDQPSFLLQVPVREGKRKTLQELLERYFCVEELSEEYTNSEGVKLTHKIPELIGDPPQALFIQFKLFASKKIVKYEQDIKPKMKIAADDAFGRVAKPVEKTYAVRRVSPEDVRRIPPTQYKIDSNVVLDTKHPLDMSAYYGAEPGTHLYELVATCDHHGSLNGGHYTANTKVGRRWWTRNDNSSAARKKDADFSKSYILTLRKVEPGRRRR